MGTIINNDFQQFSTANSGLFSRKFCKSIFTTYHFSRTEPWKESQIRRVSMDISDMRLTLRILRIVRMMFYVCDTTDSLAGKWMRSVSIGNRFRFECERIIALDSGNFRINLDYKKNCRISPNIKATESSQILESGKIDMSPLEVLSLNDFITVRACCIRFYTAEYTYSSIVMRTVHLFNKHFWSTIFKSHSHSEDEYLIDYNGIESAWLRRFGGMSVQSGSSDSAISNSNSFGSMP